jgi:ubiquinone/menaquinone biosynthesis C-methylase UbiE
MQAAACADLAIYFASKLELSFECITISQLQVEIAQGKIAENNMRGKIRVSRGDFHCLPDQFPPDSFDRVLFLEALCHSNDFSRALSAAYAVLKTRWLHIHQRFYPYKLAP